MSNENNYADRTVDALEDELGKRGLEAPSGALKADLVAMLVAHDQMGEHAPEVQATPEPEADNDRPKVPSVAERQAEREAAREVQRQLIEAADQKRRETDTTVDWSQYPNKERPDAPGEADEG